MYNNWPIEKFSKWFEEYKKFTSSDDEANSAILSTSSKMGHVTSRVVLIKFFDHQGLTFFTNLESQKSTQIFDNHCVALCYNWSKTKKQVRIEGKASQINSVIADNYFASRSFHSQISAYSSKQSCVLSSRQELIDKFIDNEKRFADMQNIPRPHFWSGFKIYPTRVEFWENMDHRMHIRVNHEKNIDGIWEETLLYP